MRDLAIGLLRRFLSVAEFSEVERDLLVEYAERRRLSRWSADRWIWRQVISSAPRFAMRSVWRGWSGFSPHADRWRPAGQGSEEWSRTFRFSLRRLRRRPVYLVVATSTLALGVAGVAAAVAIARPLLWDPLPVQDEEQVFAFWAPLGWSEQEFDAVRPTVEAFESIAAYRPADVTLRLRNTPARLVGGIAATAGLFDVLGVRPRTGPGFTAESDRMGSEATVVISDLLWRQLGSPTGIVGEGLDLSGTTRRVVGVMPEGFWFPTPDTDVWISEEVDPENRSGNYALVGRARDGVGDAGLEVEIGRITDLLGARFTYSEQWDMTRDAALTPIRDDLVGSMVPVVWAMVGGMLILLLIATCNVTALMLGQLNARSGEMGVRRALGAGWKHLRRQLFVEALLLGSIAGAAGAVLAAVMFDLFISTLPLGNFASGYSLSGIVLGAAILFALLAATAATLLLASVANSAEPATTIRRMRTGGIEGRRISLEQLLVVGQISMVLILTASGGLLLRSVLNLRGIEPGFEADGVGVIDVLIPESLQPAEMIQVLDRMVDAAGQTPGVDEVAAAQILPLRNTGNNWGIRVEGQPELPSTTTYMRPVGPGYFRTLGIPLVRGRTFDDGDRLPGDEAVVVINQELADRYFPDQDPIGRRIAWGSEWDRIVGVVASAPEGALTDEMKPTRFHLYNDVPLWGSQSIVLRTNSPGNLAARLEEARRRIVAVAPSVAIQEMTTMDQIYSRSIGPARNLLLLLSLLAAISLTLGIVGVYGVVSHFVSRRSRDWGIRIALGLLPRQLIRQILWRGGIVVGLGVVVGLAVFVVASRMVGSFLYEVGTADPISLLASVVLILTTGVGASYLPARRATQIDPVLTLRDG